MSASVRSHAWAMVYVCASVRSLVWVICGVCLCVYLCVFAKTFVRVL